MSTRQGSKFSVLIAGLVLAVTVLAAPLALAQSGMVAAAHPLAIQEGEKVLLNGGNAIEAAIVTAAVLGVVEPYASGIGGGGFMVVHIPQAGSEPAQRFVIDSRVTAPQDATPDMFRGLTLDQIDTGGLAVGVPGALKHWDEALKISRELQLSGRLQGLNMTLSQALQPAIEIARNGFDVSDTFIRILNTHRNRLAKFPDSAALFFDLPTDPAACAPEAPPLPACHLTQSALADTLELVAAQGTDVFYHGPIADAIVDTVRHPKTDDPNILSGRMRKDDGVDDLALYDIKRRDPVTGTYKGFTLVTAGPPAGGVTLIELLNIVDDPRFPFGSPDFPGFGFLQTDTVHVMIEAMKLSYADKRAFLGDPDFALVPPPGDPDRPPIPITGLTSPAYAAERRSLIDLATSLPVEQDPGNPYCFETPPPLSACPSTSLSQASKGVDEEVLTLEEESSTTHFSAIDGFGNMVAYTTSLSSLFGSAMVVTCEIATCAVEGRRVGGFLLNNSLNGFSRGTSPGVRYNAPEGGKRPRSDMSPTLVFSPSGTPRLVVGAAGGGRIPAIVFQIISDVIDHGKSIQQAISAPRFVNENLAQSATTIGHHNTRHETPPFNLPQTLVNQLRDNKGQTVIRNTVTFGAAQGIAIDPDTGALSRGTDPRRGGDF